MTVFRLNDIGKMDQGPQFGVCSRNYELKMSDTDNAFVSTALKLKLHEKLNLHNVNVALQGELIGPGIQGNPYNLSGTDFYVFDIFDINKQEYYSPEQRQFLCNTLSIKHVPTFAPYETDSMTTVPELLTLAQGQSVLNTKTEREGLVFKNLSDPKLSFKAISNKWLLKND